MQDLRLVLIILGFMAIVALIAHGLWSNKKNQVKPLKDKPLNKLDQSVKDKQGFDLDGIGEKRVVAKSVEPTMSFDSDEPVPVSVEKVEPQFSAVNSSAVNSSPVSSRPLKTNEPQASNDAAPKETVVTASFSAIDVETPVVVEHAETVDRVKSDLSYDVVDDAANAEIDVVVDNTLAAAEPQQSTPVAAVQDDAVEEAVFVINIMAREGKSIAGAELLQELSAFGFKFGAMNIFHRHVDAAGKGAVIFSLANMVKPGTFDIDTMEQFESPGVSLFMMFPCAGQASHNYGLMLSAAERIADGVDGLLMDGSRHPLTEEAIEQEQTFIRQLESRALAK